MRYGSNERKRWVGFGRPAWIALAVSGLLSGCGGEAETNGRVPSMLGTQAKSAAARTTGSNSRPNIESIRLSPERPSPGRVIESRAIVTDADGDATQVEYRWESSDGSLLGKGPRLDTAGLSPGESITVLAIASDGQDESLELSRRVRLAEQEAQVAIVAIDASEGRNPGAVLNAYFESTDEGYAGMGAEYEWQVNGETVSTEDELNTAEYSPGDMITLRARLAEGSGRNSRFVSSQPITLVRGDGPKILSEPLAGIEAGLFRYQMRAKSPSSEAHLSYELLSGPQGMTVDAESGLVEWRPATSQRGRFEVELAVTDQWGSGVAQSFAIEAAAPIAPPASRR